MLENECIKDEGGVREGLLDATNCAGEIVKAKAVRNIGAGIRGQERGRGVISGEKAIVE